MSAPHRAGEVVRDAAESVALDWAREHVTVDSRDRFSSGPTPNERLASALLLDYHAELEDLRKRFESTERLARSLGYDMLYALEAAYTDDDSEVHESPAAEQILGGLDIENLAPEGMTGLARRAIRAERALLYLARGWRRDMDDIDAATTTEGLALAARLPDTSVVE